MNNDPWSDVRSSSINDDIESAITSLSNSNANNNSFLLSNHRKNSIHSDIQKPLSINEELNNKDQPSPILRRTTLSLGGYSLQNGNQSYKGNYNNSLTNQNNGFSNFNNDNNSFNPSFAHQFNNHNSVNYPLNNSISTNSGQTNMTSNYVHNRRGSYTMSKININMQNNSILMNQVPQESNKTSFFENFGKQLVEATKEVEQNEEPANTSRVSFSESEGRSHSIRDTINSLNPQENNFSNSNMGWMNQNNTSLTPGFIPQFQGFYQGPPIPPNFMMPFMNNNFIPPQPVNSSSNENNDENVEMHTPVPNVSHDHPPLSPPTGMAIPGMNGTPLFVPMSMMNTPISSPPVSVPQQNPPNSKNKRQSKQNKFNKRKEPVIRSEKLEHFIKTYKDSYYTIDYVLGNSLEFCRDQVGSRFIQEVIPKTDDELLVKFYNEIDDSVYQLMIDVFGNYVIQKLLETIKNQEIRNKIMEHVKGNVITLTKSQYGCRIIQKALSNLSLDHKMIIANELKETDIKDCINDQNGNHVIQKAIENIPIKNIMFIVDQLKTMTSKYATHSYGCRVIQRLLEFGDDETRTNILEELKPHFSELIKNEFGNYVIQYILKSSNEKSATLEDSKIHIIDLVQKNILDFSCHKYASNVVEQIFVLGNENQKKTMYDLILPQNTKEAADLKEEEMIYLMMKDQYANYVIQKMVKLSLDGSKNQKLLVLSIRSYLDKLKKAQTPGQQNNANQRKNKNLASVDKLSTLIQNIKI
ncbi:mRNA-binding protein PUF3 [Hanseniaspora uvarum]|uniref:mRNA-binding protein PUF3 n=1 Tax=Hanseniaspora uvarum TaxID=29833 RepID=A0A1E5RXX7_HANUV|nr:mRNA-binding protein PUF3 [Hanseniaspora uvarum]